MHDHHWDKFNENQEGQILLLLIKYSHISDLKNTEQIGFKSIFHRYDTFFLLFINIIHLGSKNSILDSQDANDEIVLSLRNNLCMSLSQ